MSKLSIVIPSLNRGRVLLDTIGFLQSQTIKAYEIVIVDQTSYSEGDAVKQQLLNLDSQKVIRYYHRQEPSIPKAMNAGLLLAESEFVLFLDDDINIKPDFLEAHLNALTEHSLYAHVGQILQPGEAPKPKHPDYQAGDGLLEDLSFPFSSTEPALIKNCMAGNLCVNRVKAVQAGGFDENFIGAAYRFETEFCKRMIRFHGDAFYFAPQPVLYHLQSPSGGTRTNDHFLVSSSPRHSVGDYYYAFLEGDVNDGTTYSLRRFFCSVKARFYLKKPWYIPVRLFAELRGFLMAWKLYRQGARHCKQNLGDDV